MSVIKSKVQSDGAESFEILKYVSHISEYNPPPNATADKSSLSISDSRKILVLNNNNHSHFHQLNLSKNHNDEVSKSITNDNNNNIEEQPDIPTEVPMIKCTENVLDKSLIDNNPSKDCQNNSTMRLLSKN